MTIKKQFILLASIIVTIPILTVSFLLIQNYYISPKRTMIEKYNHLVEENREQYTEEELKIIYRTLKRISPDFEFVLFAKNKVIFSNIDDFSKGDDVSYSILVELIDSSSKKFIYQFRRINNGHKKNQDTEYQNDSDYYLLTRIIYSEKHDKLNFKPITTLMFSIIGIILFCVILIIFISKNIFNSIEKLEKQTQAIADGNLTIKIDTGINEIRANEITSISTSLEKMRISLLEAQNRKYRFIMGISHDLRTPVSIIKGYTEALLDGIINDEKEIYKSLNLINIKTSQLEEMIDTLLNFMKLNSTELRHKLVPKSITDLITDFAKTSEISANVFKRNIYVDIDLPYDIKVPLDNQLVNRAFENIFNNALRYTKDNDSIYISAFIKDKNILFSIKDTGVGMNDEDLKNIFELFYRGTSSRREEGMGIGLSVVKNILETHGWSISVESKINQGSRFTVTIPF